jgi:hypothetical protein
METDILTMLEYLLEAMSSMWCIPRVYSEEHKEKLGSGSDNQQGESDG